MNTREVTHQYRLKQWAEIVQACRSSGQTISAWCTDHDINPKSYYYWLKRIRTAACEALPSLSTPHNPIVPVNFPFPAADTAPTEDKSASDITLRLGAVTLAIHNSASATLIENTLKALQHVR